MTLLRSIWDRITALVELVILISTVAAAPAVMIAWLAILPTIGLLWSVGWLK